MIFQAFGQIANPLEILDTSNVDRGLTDAGGLVSLISSVVRLITIAAGIFALFQLITAGIQYVSSQGDPKMIEVAQNKIFMSIIGLVIVAAAFIITALVGQLLFGDPSIFINPKIYGPGQVPSN